MISAILRAAASLATVEAAGSIFAEEVVQPALAAAPGLAQLTALCEAFSSTWSADLSRRLLHGQCGAGDGHPPGPVRELIAAFQVQFAGLIRGFAAIAIEQGQLPGSEDPDRLAFEVNGIILAADTNFVLHDNPAVLDLARQVVRQRLTPASAPQ